MMPDVIVLNPDLVAHLTRKSSYLPFYDGTVSRPSSGVVARFNTPIHLCCRLCLTMSNE